MIHPERAMSTIQETVGPPADAESVSSAASGHRNHVTTATENQGLEAGPDT